SVAGHTQDLPIVHRTLYGVHQRVAKTYHHGRVLLVGDAAHINNPLGGMGMNGGIHDAMNLVDKLAAVLEGGDAGLLDLYSRQLLLSILGRCAAGPAPAQAQARVVRVVVGSPPGALGDVVARLVAEKLAEGLATPTIVDNKAGASGLIAADLVAKSAGDGAN